MIPHSSSRCYSRTIPPSDNGNPEVLGQDALWRSFLNYVYVGGGWKGPKMSWDPSEPVTEEGYDEAVRMHAEEDMLALIHRLRGLGLDDEGDEMEGTSIGRGGRRID